MLIGWWLLSILNIFSPVYFAGPIATFSEISIAINEIQLPRHVFITLYRVILSTAAAFFIGTVLGILLGRIKVLYLLFSPIVDFFRSIPAAAFFPLFILIFGIGNMAKIAVAVFACSLIFLVNVCDAVRNLSQVRITVAESFGIGWLTIIRKVILYEMLPQILIAVRVTLSLSLILIIFSEMFIGTKFGMGRIIMDSQEIYNTPRLYLCIIITGCMGFILNRIVLGVEKRILFWRVCD